MTTANELSNFLDHLTRETPECSRLVDEIRHTGGAGISFVERWALSSDEGSPWVWRLMFVPANHPHASHYHRQGGTRIAFGWEPSQEEAVREGSKEARRLAKARRNDGSLRDQVLAAFPDWKVAGDLPINSALENN